MPKEKPHNGELSPQDIAAGMNAASRNALRLLDDAQFLAEKGRYPTACSLAILAIEEAGKMPLLRLIATARNQTELKKAWHGYRSHQTKNTMWIVGKLVADGARTLTEFGGLFDPESDHPALLDALKQLGFYTDCYKEGFWSEPVEIIGETLTETILSIAKILCRGQEISIREVELWVRHVGNNQTPSALIAFFAAMEEEGFADKRIDDIRKFVLGEP